MNAVSKLQAEWWQRYQIARAQMSTNQPGLIATEKGKANGAHV